MIREFHAANAPGFRPALHGGRPATTSSSKACRSSPRSTGWTGSTDLEMGGQTAPTRSQPRVRIVDYKSGFKSPQPRPGAAESDQLTLYQVAVETVLGLEVESVGLYHVPSQTLFDVPAHGPERVDELRRRVVRIARAIERQEYEPRPGRRCDWCDFRAWCPAWAHEYPENWAAGTAAARALARRCRPPRRPIRGDQGRDASVGVRAQGGAGASRALLRERPGSGPRPAIVTGSRRRSAPGTASTTRSLKALLESGWTVGESSHPRLARPKNPCSTDPDLPAEIRLRMEENGGDRGGLDAFTTAAEKRRRKPKDRREHD